MKKVIVTGATGFIGRNCLSGLVERGYEVYACGCHKLPYWVELIDGVTPLQVNILDFKSVSQVLKQVKASHLLHLAWYVKHGEFWNHVSNFNWLAASIHLISEFAKNGGVRVVTAGSCAEYDWTRKEKFSEEQTPLQPLSIYGHCKKILYDVFSHQSVNLGVSVAHGRIFFLYGPHEFHKRLVPYVISNFLKQEIAICENGDLFRDYMYVKDVAESFNHLLDSSFEGPMNIVSNEPLTLKDLVLKIANMMDAEDLVKFGQKPIPDGVPYTIVSDDFLLGKELNFSKRYSIDTGLSETIDWWSKQKK